MLCCSVLPSSFWISFCLTVLKINLPLACLGYLHQFWYLVIWSGTVLSCTGFLWSPRLGWLYHYRYFSAGFDLHSLLFRRQKQPNYQFAALVPAKISNSFVHRSVKISLKLFSLTEMCSCPATFKECTCLIGKNLRKKCWIFYFPILVLHTSVEISRCCKKFPEKLVSFPSPVTPAHSAPPLFARCLLRIVSNCWVLCPVSLCCLNKASIVRVPSSPCWSAVLRSLQIRLRLCRVSGVFTYRSSTLLCSEPDQTRAGTEERPLQRGKGRGRVLSGNILWKNKAEIRVSSENGKGLLGWFLLCEWVAQAGPGEACEGLWSFALD